MQLPHKLRHYFASEMSALGVPEADILKMGGWETDHVMKSVYRHSMMEKAKREAAERLRKKKPQTLDFPEKILDLRLSFDNRGDRIRTCDFLVPNQAL